MNIEEKGPAEMDSRVMVKGPLCCFQHGRKVTFVFDYTTHTYHHVIIHKNGAMSICQSQVEIKKW